jgi:Flp pilus assembly protein TadD
VTSRARAHDPRRLLLVVLAIGLALRVAHLLLDRGDPFFEPTLLDAKYYDQWARRILGGDVLSAGVFYGLPLYPYFLALCYALSGGSVVAVKLVQLALGLTTICLTYAIGARLADSTVGLVAAALAAMYGPLFFHESMLIPEALGVPLYAGGFYACCLFLDAPSARRGALAGIMLGLACLTKAGVMPFVALFVAVLILRPALAAARPTAGSLAALVLSFVAVLAPVTLHNVVLGGDTVLLTSHAGLNFYIGNNAQADGTFRAPRGTGIGLEEQIADSRAIAEAAEGRALKPSEVSAYWSGQAWAFIRGNPLRFAALSGRKLLLAFDARELPDLQDYHAAGRFDPLMRLPWPTFVVLGPLAVAGLLLGAPLRYRWCVVLWIGSYLMGLATFFVNARYRLPMLSVLCVLAALGLCTFVTAARARAWRPLATWGVVVVAAISIARLALVPTDPARDLVNAGNLRLDARDYAQALAFYREALALDPENPRGNLGMGIVLAHLGRMEEAGPFYARSAAASPDPLAYNNLGTWYQQHGDLEEAERNYRRAIEIKPQFAQAHDNLGIVYARQGDIERAIESFRTALRLDPGSCTAAINLGHVLEQAGRVEEARREWQVALGRDPTCEGAKRALGGR